jgi:predicted small secreted protein
MLQALGLVLAVAAVAAACGGGTTVSGVGEDDYVRANERLLQTLPVFPRAREVSRSSAPYFAGDSSGTPPAGYTTLAVYELARHRSQRAVIDFYVARMNGWSSRVDFAPGVDVVTGASRPGAWSASFTRGGASVAVNTDNLMSPRGRRFEVTVDHRGARE